MAIKKCSCPHTSQDELNGKGMRVFNLNAKGNWRCSVCTKEVSGEREAATKVKGEKKK